MSYSTVYVFGAGATYGASFVSPDRFPCTPPLDFDFFTKLQRVRSSKHKEIAQPVIWDVVNLFGPNFSVTLEEVFSTYAELERMSRLSRGKLYPGLPKLRKMRDRLEQAIHVLLEESLTEPAPGGVSTTVSRACEYHNKFAKKVLRRRECVISFNYDCLLDESLRRTYNRWNPSVGYWLGSTRSRIRLEQEAHWAPRNTSSEKDSAELLKLHGSLHFQEIRSAPSTVVKLKRQPYTRRHGNPRFEIIPPVWGKALERNIFKSMWVRASSRLKACRRLVLIGYSMPTSDLHAATLFRSGLEENALNSLVVVNPDPSARRRSRAVLHRAIGPKTRVVSLDKLSEFVALDPAAWR